MFGVGGDSGSSMIRALCSVYLVLPPFVVLVDVQCGIEFPFSVLSAYVVAITHTHTRILFYFILF